ncbi:hypothetical protein [Polluticoccus soli]|uniref:hypothetical protein n=1 Tax=Polluticoccus soli TaxID=3034150 RepID=UPI0023E26F1E|nr:hypothetical protein [Flavipsychrobacter sp. JY13-12]
MNIVISNMDSHTTAADVQVLLKEFGEITVRQIRSVVHASGKLQTSAHVQTDDRTTGEQIIAKLNKTEVDGNVIGVKEAKR